MLRVFFFFVISNVLFYFLSLLIKININNTSGTYKAYRLGRSIKVNGSITDISL